MGRKESFIAFIIMGSIAGVGLKALHVPPNIELLMPFVMAFSLVSGPLYGFLMGLGIRAIYDVYMSWVGPWTLFTSVSYGCVGLVIGLFGMRKKVWDRKELVLLAALTTILYDLLTIIPFGVMFRLQLVPMLLAQIPFSINHVVGNCLFVFLLVPYLVPLVNKIEAMDISVSFNYVLNLFQAK